MTREVISVLRALVEEAESPADVLSAWCQCPAFEDAVQVGDAEAVLAAATRNCGGVMPDIRDIVIS